MNWETWAVTIINGCLVFLLGLMLKSIIGYIKDLIDEVKGFKTDVKNIEAKLKDTDSRIFQKICALEENLWQSVNKLRRTVGSSALVIRRRRKETDQILEEQRGAKDKLEALKSAAKIGARIFKKHERRLGGLEKNIIRINDDLIMIKGKSNGSK